MIRRAPASACPVPESKTLTVTSLTFCGTDGGAALTVRVSFAVFAPDAASTPTVTSTPFAAGAPDCALSLINSGVAVSGVTFRGLPQPLEHETPGGRPVGLISTDVSVGSLVVTFTVTVTSLPALTVADVGLSDTSGGAAWAGDGATRSAPTASAATTPARSIHARRCVVTSTAFRSPPIARMHRGQLCLVWVGARKAGAPGSGTPVGRIVPTCPLRTVSPRRSPPSWRHSMPTRNPSLSCCVTRSGYCLPSWQNRHRAVRLRCGSHLTA